MSVVLIVTGGERNLLWVWNYCEAIHWSLYLISLLRTVGRWKSSWLVWKCQPGISFRHLAFISRAFPSLLTNLDLAGFAPLKLFFLHTMPMEKSRECPNLLVSFPTQRLSKWHTRSQWKEQNQSTQISHSKAIQGGQADPCPWDETHWGGSRRDPSLPSQLQQTMGWLHAQGGTYFGLYWGKRTVLWDILKGFSVKCPMRHLVKEPKLGKASRWLRFWVK